MLPENNNKFLLKHQLVNVGSSEVDAAILRIHRCTQGALYLIAVPIGIMSWTSLSFLSVRVTIFLTQDSVREELYIYVCL